jgi:CDP-paratose 2-epimerase
MRILITGGAGFVGSHLAKSYQESGAQVVVLDNLKRRGSERNLAEFRQRGIAFVHGDIRNLSDLEELEGNFDLFLEASAEPSVHAGTSGSPKYVIDTNLGGTYHCLEFARSRVAGLIFLSTSRVYSIVPLSQLPLTEDSSRFEIRSSGQGFSPKGIAEDFPTNTSRSFYGATKLASEMLVQEYAATYGLKAVINRCGVIAGAGQFGKLDQGVFTLWIANHFYQKPLRYTGFGGQGKQVRDLLHPRDLFALIEKQVPLLGKYSGEYFNVGGGREISTSLQEWTRLAEQCTGKTLDITSVKETAAVDIPYYVGDSSKAQAAFSWKPKMGPQAIAEDIAQWIRANQAELKSIF